MPFKSKTQARFMFKKHPEVAKEFAAKTGSIKKLPEHTKKKKRSTYSALERIAEAKVYTEKK